MSLQAWKFAKICVPRLKQYSFGNVISHQTKNSYLRQTFPGSREDIKIQTLQPARAKSQVYARCNQTVCRVHSRKWFCSVSSETSITSHKKATDQDQNTEISSSSVNGPSIAQELTSGIYHGLRLGSLTAEAVESALLESGFHSDVVRG